MFCRGRNVNKFILKFMILKASSSQNGSSQLSKPSKCWVRSSIDSYLELLGDLEAINHNSSSIDGGDVNGPSYCRLIINEFAYAERVLEERAKRMILNLVC